MLGISLIGIFVMLIWWILALFVALWRVKPNDKRYKAPKGVAGDGARGTLFALWTHNSGGGE